MDLCFVDPAQRAGQHEFHIRIVFVRRGRFDNQHMHDAVFLRAFRQNLGEGPAFKQRSRQTNQHQHKHDERD